MSSENSLEDFIVDDGYNCDNDPDYKPGDEYLVYGDDFKKLVKKAIKLGAEYFNYSKRKGKKYVVYLPNGKKIHFGSSKYADYLTHRDKERRDKYLNRAKSIRNERGELTYKNPETANYWSVNLLWQK